MTAVTKSKSSAATTKKGAAPNKTPAVAAVARVPAAAAPKAQGKAEVKPEPAAQPKPQTAPQAVPQAVLQATKPEAKPAPVAAPFASYEDVVAFNRDTMDAFLKSGTVLVKGWQDFGRAMAGLAQENVDETVAGAKAVMNAKTMREAMDLQAAMLKDRLDRGMNETARLGEAGAKLAEEAFAPLQARAEEIVGQFGQSKA